MTIKSFWMSFTKRTEKFIPFLKTQKMLLLEFLTQKYIKSFLIRENYFQIAKSTLLYKLITIFM